jgi:hypothetical protein
MLKKFEFRPRKILLKATFILKNRSINTFAVSGGVAIGVTGLATALVYIFGTTITLIYVLKTPMLLTSRDTLDTSITYPEFYDIVKNSLISIKTQVDCIPQALTHLPTGRVAINDFD